MSSHTRPTPLRDSPFAFTRPSRRRGWLDRMFDRPRPDLANDALKHLLSLRDPSRVSAGDISSLLLEYGVTGAEARELLVHMWRRVLAVFLEDNAFSDREIAYLAALRTAFQLTDAEIADAERRVVHPRYEVAVRDALADRRLSDDERRALARLAERLRLPDDVRREILTRSSKQVLTDVLRDAASDRRLSPEELERLTALARHLGVAVDVGSASSVLLDRFALFWRIENGDIPVVDATIPLEADEHCHYIVQAQAHEPRRFGDEVEGVGTPRIARGVFFRVGSVSGDRLDRDAYRQVDEGRLLITNRRLLFEGSARNASLPLTEIVAYQVYADGLVIERALSKGPFLTLSGDVEMAAVVLGAALARA